MRRTVSLLALLGSIALVTVGCSDEPSSAGIAHAETSASYERATDAEVTAGAEVVSHVGAELYGPIAEDAGDGNIAFSPLSIAVALGMARAGAEGDAADQLDGFFGADGTDVHRSLNGAVTAFHDETGPVELDNGEMSEIELTNANALWGQSGVTWKTPFLDELRSSYDASMWTADFEADPEAARIGINDWVAEHTREHIKALLPKGSVDHLTRLVLTNALFFKAPWPEELHRQEDTTPFTRPDGSTVDASMLGTTRSLAYQKGDGWQAVALPYAGGDLAMTLLVPDEGKLADVEGTLDADFLHQVTTGGEPTQVGLTFPAFDLDQRAPIADVLKGLGVTAPFTAETDFAPMSSDPEAKGLHVDDVLHQATVTVDEYGTEASAATAVTMGATSAPMDPVLVTVDRPFLFVINDVATGTPMFIGRVADPTAK
ncbi:MAG: serpin family protein [Aquihabitans sp.]